jgi:hypothetical protein
MRAAGGARPAAPWPAPAVAHSGPPTPVCDRHHHHPPSVSALLHHFSVIHTPTCPPTPGISPYQSGATLATTMMMMMMMMMLFTCATLCRSAKEAASLASSSAARRSALEARYDAGSEPVSQSSSRA